MRTRSHALALVLVATLAIISAGCGDDDGGGGGNAAVTDENRPYVDAMKKAMQDANEDEEAIVMSDSQIDCMAPRWVNTIGLDRFEAQGIAAEELAENTELEFSELGLAEAEGEALYDAFGQCDIDLQELIMESMSGDEDMSEAAKTCMEGVFTDENLRKFMVSSLVNGDDGMEDDPELAPIVGQMMGCAFMGMGDAEAEFDEIGSSINGG